MEASLAQLKDIDGIDAISWWPLAIGWWVVIGIVVAVIIAALIMLNCRKKYLLSWQRSILEQLSILENTLTNETSLSVAIDLSELMRRIAISKYSRAECAGLEGKDWLVWIKKHDTQSFDWVQNARWMVDAPYAPSDMQLPPEEIKQVIKAIRGWVK